MVGDHPFGLDQIISDCLLLLDGGAETTRTVIARILVALADRPDQWELLKGGADLAVATEEFIRWVTPIHNMCRVAAVDTEVAGTPIPEGAMLWVMFGSANRDERVFPDPDRFDPARTNLNDSVAFGRGAHFCIGAPLARLEIRVLFEELAKRLESVGFAPGSILEYEPSFILRGLKELEIEVVRRPPSALLEGRSE